MHGSGGYPALHIAETRNRPSPHGSAGQLRAIRQGYTRYVNPPVSTRPQEDPAGSDPSLERTQILGIGSFLAASWTWCIGMFLPVLLYRDLGVWSFLVFAVPNCVGAALMGYVLRRPGASEQMVRAHTAACVWFSRVTVAFHAFFLMWIVGREGSAAPVILGFLVNIAVNLLSTRLGWTGWAPAVMTYLTSIACACVMALSGGLMAHPATPPILPATDLLWLAPVCIFGFLFCPYLDLTFHAARRTLPGAAGTRAFVLGFGGLFFAMIILTLAYAGMFLRADPTFGLGGHVAAGEIQRIFGLAAVSGLFVHIASQAAFTMHAHLGMVSRTTSGSTWRMDPVSLACVILPMLLGLAAPSLPDFGGRYALAGSMSGGETIYRSFMAFYGLVFPAYVWICVLPAWNARPTRGQVLAFAAAVGIATPMFYMGFIERQMVWLGPGLGVVLTARLFAGLGGKRAAIETPGE